MTTPKSKASNSSNTNYFSCFSYHLFYDALCISLAVDFSWVMDLFTFSTPMIAFRSRELF